VGGGVSGWRVSKGGVEDALQCKKYGMREPSFKLSSMA
jgi:hypothetical protein